MKRLSFLALAAVGLLLGACTSDKLDDEKSTGKILEEKGVAYFKVNVNLPTVANGTTRAWEEGGTNSKLDDGMDAEYAVDNVLLILFGTDGDTGTGTVVQWNKLEDYNMASVTEDNPNQVTKNLSQVVTLTAASQAYAHLYALAVVNYTGVIEPGNSQTTLNILKTDGSGGKEENVSNVTLERLQSAIALSTATAPDNIFVKEVTVGSNKEKHIFMTNAVLSKVRGGTKNPNLYPGATSGAGSYILPEVNPLYIFETKAEAQDSPTPAVDIYVERAVAKVTIDGVGTGGALTIAATGPKLKGSGTLSAVLSGWTLGNTNAKSYVVRQVPAYASGVFAWNYINSQASGDVYRFVGNYPVDAEYGTETAGYRTYWALDPNYNEYKSAEMLNPTWTDDNSWAKEFGDTKPLYCYENTFDVANQSYKNTTTAVLKVTFNTTEDFYTVGADRKSLYSADDVETLIANALMGLSDFVDEVKTKNGGTELTITKDHITPDWGTAAGAVTISDITVKIGSTDYTMKTGTNTFTKGTSYLTSVQSQVSNINRYDDGVSYYAIRIQHFGKELTPWNSESGAAEYGTDDAPAESSIATIYPGTGDDQNNRYLGRYGMVRNNWYLLTIGDILKIGAATPGQLELDGDHPDDKLEDSYIKARINILSWAKRPQSWQLK